MSTLIGNKWGIWVGSLTLVATAGCATRYEHSLTVPPPSSDLLSIVEARQVAAESSDTLPPTLTLLQAIDVALQNHPELVSANALIGVAQGNALQAGLYPNPTVGYIGEQLGSRENGAGQQGPFVSQEIVTGGKLGVSQSAALDAVTANQWQAISKRFDLEAKVRAAFYDALTAQREVSENEAIVKIALESTEASQKMEKAGRGATTDVLRAKVEYEVNLNKLISSRERLKVAWPLLANVIGKPGAKITPLQGDLEQGRPEYQLAHVQETVLSKNSQLMQAQASISEAEKLITRSRLENIPNVDLKVQPLYDYTQSVSQVSFEVGMRIPVWNKNQGNIQAAEAELARRVSELQNTKLQLSDRVLLAYQRYATARDQVNKFEKELLPQAREAQRLSKSAFESGDAKYDYTALLDAQRTYAQARLSYVQTLGEFWKAAAEIHGLLQQAP
ncbi:MAG: TolC family protein [Planctomycetia bacterium]|nr:TolC family protein [Planctomycetia bacterium]